MSIEEELHVRSESRCELCNADQNLEIYAIPPETEIEINNTILVCTTCKNQIENPDEVDSNHWRCLNDSMWSQTPAVQVMAWRMLTRLRGEGWPQDLLDMLYLDEKVLSWAKLSVQIGDTEPTVQHRDSNGTLLEAGDSVTLIKDLNVKGAGFTAKRGTIVRTISLVADNSEHIEGRVSGQQIVILTKFVKKSS